MHHRICLTGTILVLSMLIVRIIAQDVQYNFNGCILSDDSNLLQPINPNTSDTCQCGVEGDGIYIDGNDQYYRLDKAFLSLVEAENYTIKFSFLPQDDSKPQTLFAIMKDCSRDSMLSVQYIPQDQQVDILISRILGDSWTTRGDILPERCWHEVAISKSNSLYSFYLDNIFIESFDNIVPFPISQESEIYLGYSPCVEMGTANVFDGIIDELHYTTTVLSSSELQASSIQPDLIMNNDTTIIAGSEVQIISGPTCANSVNWFPSNAINTDDAIAPILSPVVTTEYTRELSHNGCTMTDQIIINVIEESNVDCSNLLLPNVFTPNGDGVNDMYGISNLFIVDELNSFEIFDRWGESVFFTTTKGEGWNGMFKGSPAMIGMYVYKINYNCQSNAQEVIGSFSLMR